MLRTSNVTQVKTLPDSTGGDDENEGPNGLTTLQKIAAIHLALAANGSNMPKTIINLIFALDGRNLRETFSQSILVTGNTDFKHEDMQTTAEDFARAFLTLHAETTQCLRAVLNGADNFGNPIPGESTTHLIDLSGMFQLPGSSVLAPSEEVLIVNKKAAIGRMAPTKIRNVWASDELNAFWESDVLPARFTAPMAYSGFVGVNFEDALKNAGSAQGHTMCLPDYYNRVNVGARPITYVKVAGWGHLQAHSQKQSAEAAVIAGAQMTVNALAARIRKTKRLDVNGILPDWTDGVIAQLQLDARNAVAGLSSFQKGSLIWPPELGLMLIPLT